MRQPHLRLCDETNRGQDNRKHPQLDPHARTHEVSTLHASKRCPRNITIGADQVEHSRRWAQQRKRQPAMTRFKQKSKVAHGTFSPVQFFWSERRNRAGQLLAEQQLLPPSPAHTRSARSTRPWLSEPTRRHISDCARDPAIFSAPPTYQKKLRATSPLPQRERARSGGVWAPLRKCIELARLPPERLYTACGTLPHDRQACEAFDQLVKNL